MASAPGEEEAVDPFGFIDRECGPISPSLEERLFRLSPFINDNPPLAPLSPLPPADAPILICSLPDEQSPPPPPQEPNNNKVESPSSKPTAATTSTKTKNKKKDGKRRRRLMGAQLRTSSSSSDTDDTQPPAEPEMAPPPPPPATTTRKLPESILKQNADRRDVSKEEATDVAPTESLHRPPCDLVVTLEDVVRKYSRQPDTTYDHMSLLEIAEMKGFFDRTSS